MTTKTKLTKSETLAQYGLTEPLAMTLPGCSAVVYVGTNTKGLIIALAFAGKSMKPKACYSFPALDNATRWAGGWLETKDAADKRLAVWRAAKQAEDVANLAAAVPGAIFYTTWGYDQTNVSFYKVLERAGKSVVIQEIKGREVEIGFQSMSGRAYPLLDAEGNHQLEGNPKRVKKLPGRLYTRDGIPCSWYG